MSLVVKRSPAEGPGWRVGAGAQLPAEPEYHFLVGRLIDAATLTRASVLAARWGVHPHDVMIANGWLAEDDYYRALAGACGTPFKAGLTPSEAALPAHATPRQCLASGLLKMRTRTFVLAPERLRPTALRVMLARLALHGFALATPRAVRDAIYHHFAPSLAKGAVETLAVRRPEQSARTRTPRWQRAALTIGAAGLLGALLLAPIETIRTTTLLLAVLFVPVIGLRAAPRSCAMAATSSSRWPRSRCRGNCSRKSCG